MKNTMSVEDPLPTPTVQDHVTFRAFYDLIRRPSERKKRRCPGCGRETLGTIERRMCAECYQKINKAPRMAFA